MWERAKEELHRREEYEDISPYGGEDVYVPDSIGECFYELVLDLYINSFDKINKEDADALVFAYIKEKDINDEFLS